MSRGRSDVRRRSKVERYDRGERIDTMGTNVYSSKDNKSMHKALNGEFLLYQVLVDRILNGEKKIKDKQSIFEYFQPEDVQDARTMKEFDNEYQADKAIHWYTRETCIYKILNKALRTQNISDVAAFSQFVKDLNQQLKQEKIRFEKQLKTSILTVYRGQFISKDEINRLKTTIGELLSMNSFLSTSSNKDKAIEFATSRSPPNDELTSILLEINVNIKSPSKPLADIRHLSAFAEEEEILFMFGCVFRIDNIWFDEQIQLWRAKFTLCSDGDTDLKLFTNSLDEELNGQNQLVLLGTYLIQMQKYEDAEEHYLNLLDEEEEVLKTNLDFAYCYQGLGHVYDKKGNYNKAIEHIRISLDYLSRESLDDHPLLSQCYNDLGFYYSKLSDYPTAFHFYEKALVTKNNKCSSTYEGLSQIQFELNNPTLSLQYLQKALESQSESDFASIATNYISMGRIYGSINLKDKAQQMFEQALENQLKILNEDHPDFGYTYLAMASMFADINDFEQAHQYLDQAQQLQLQTLPNTHSDFTLTYSSYGDILVKQNQFDQALIYYHKALENQLKTLLWNHPMVTQTYLTIGLVHLQLKQYESTLEYFHKVLQSELERKHHGDLTLSQSFKRLADLYQNLDQIDEALKFYLQFLDNELVTKLYEDSSLIETYERIAHIYLDKRQLPQSLLYFHRLLDCYLRKQPFDQQQIQSIYSFIGKVYLKQKNFDETLLIYNQQSNPSKKKKKNNNNSTKDFIEHVENKHFEQRHLDQSFVYFHNCLEQELENVAETDPIIGDLYQILAKICFQTKNYQQSLHYFLKLLKNKLTRRKIDGSSISNIYTAIGTIYLIEKQFHLSLIYFYRFVDCQLKKKRKSIDEAYQHIAKVYLAKHQFAQSQITNVHIDRHHLQSTLVYFHNLLNDQLRSKDLSSNKYSNEQLYIIIAQLLLDRQDFDQALTYFKELIYLQLIKQPRGDSHSANTYRIMAQLYTQQGLFDHAIYNYKQALQIYIRNSNKQQPIIQHIEHQIRQILIPQI